MTAIPEVKPPVVDTEEAGYEDYFGFDETRKWYFPDGKQYIEFQLMNEGKKAEYQNKTQRDLILERSSGNARMKLDQGSERHALISGSVIGWKMVRKTTEGKFEDAPFSKNAFDTWLKTANPVLVEGLEKEVRKANPWLMAEMSVEDIDKEIANLQEMREVAVEREKGEGGSGGR